MPTFLDVLELLPRADLVALADAFSIELPDRRRKQSIVEALVFSGEEPKQMLLLLSRDRLKELCLALNLDPSGRDKLGLVVRLLTSNADAAATGGAGEELLRSPLSEAGVLDEQSEDQILNILISALDSSRGLIEPIDARVIISVLTLLKRLNDVFDEEVGVLLSDGAPVDVAYGNPAEHEIFIPPGARWSNLVDDSPQKIDQRLNHVCSAIERANPLLEGLLTAVDFMDARRFGGLRHRVLFRELLQLLSSIELGDSMLGDPGKLGRAYGSFLETAAVRSGKRIGAATSSKTVVKLMVDLLAPAEGESICDPACGTGMTLIGCAEYIDDRGGDRTQLRLEGQEKQTDNWVLARINLLLHGLNQGRVARGDTIREPQLISTEGRLISYDRVIANPPFSLRWWGHEAVAHDPYGRFRYGIPPRDHGDFAFLQHMLAILNPRGRLVTTAPQGLLFRGKVEEQIRAAMVRDDLFEAVIGLPGGLFLGTSMPTVLLVLSLDKPVQRKGQILFIDASQDFHEARPWNQLRAEDISKILMACREFVDVPHYARVVSHAKIVENDFSLAINRYVEARVPTDNDRLESSEQMWRRVEIRNYRSIAETSVELAPFSVLVGPNGSGKSNFADALVFSRELSVDAETAVERRGGLEGIQRRQPGENADVLLDIRAASSRAGLDTDYVRHQLTIRSGGTRGWSFRSETVEIFSRGEPILKIERNSSGVEIEPSRLAESLGRLPKLSEAASIMVFARQLAVMARHTALRSVTRIRLNPDSMRQPQSSTENTRLEESGSNIAVAFRSLGGLSQERVLVAMQRIVPGLLRIFVESIDRYLLLKFEQQQSAGQVAKFSMSEMSEGALRALGILVATQQMTQDELLIIEEPEVAIHLGAAQLLFDILKDASNRGAVLITTHSADLLDAAREEEILVCSYREGTTHMGPLASSQREVVRQGLFTVAELMRSEPLRIEGEEPGIAQI